VNDTHKESNHMARCIECKHWFQFGNQLTAPLPSRCPNGRVSELVGQCRRYPPVHVRDEKSHCCYCTFPWTGDADECGEFEGGRR
jgi:hypothetical protein